MRVLFLIIFLIASTKSFSQATNVVLQKILIDDDSTNILVDIEIIKSAVNDIASNTIFYLSQKKDSSYKNLIENTSDVPTNNKVKIIFSFKEEIISNNKIKTLVSYLQNYIFDSLKKEQPSLFTKKYLFYGVNDGAIIALKMALQQPDKINKTALYFLDYSVSSEIANYLSDYYARLKGKLFIFTKNVEDRIVVLDVMITELALKSTAMFYRVDDFDDTQDIFFTQGYNWLLADGNNIILEQGY